MNGNGPPKLNEISGERIRIHGLCVMRINCDEGCPDNSDTESDSDNDRISDEEKVNDGRIKDDVKGERENKEYYSSDSDDSCINENLGNWR